MQKLLNKFKTMYFKSLENFNAIIILGNVVLPLIRAKNDGVGEIHVP